MGLDPIAVVLFSILDRKMPYVNPLLQNVVVPLKWYDHNIDI